MGARARLVDAFRSRRMAVLFALGFSSGLPNLLTSQTLKAWLGTAGLDVGAIAAFSLIGLPYALKFTWAPLLDRWRLPWLGRRRGWMIALQLALIVAIAAMGAVDPAAAPVAMVGFALAVAILSASQDVIVDAYSADLLAPEERGPGSGMYVAGYRVAMLVSGSLALILADHLPWRAVYALMAVLMIVGVLATLRAEEPPARQAPRTLGVAIALPFQDFVRRLGWRGTAAVLAFAALYNFGEQFGQVLMTTFLQYGPKLSLSEIGAINKPLGFAGTVAGAAIGGALVTRHGVWRMLIAFGLAQAATNLLYVWLALRGHDLGVFAVAVLVDNVAKAMATGAFLAYLMSLTSTTVSATQFALLTSLSSVGQRVFGPLAGRVQDAVGWSGFFVVTALLAVPGLVLAAALSRAEARRARRDAAPRASAAGTRSG